MSAKDRDRLKVLHEVRKRHIPQKQAAVELGLSERWVRTLLKRLRREGDTALRHRLRGRPSNRKTPSLAPRAPPSRLESGTFYLAKKRNFLLCVDSSARAGVLGGSQASLALFLAGWTHARLVAGALGDKDGGYGARYTGADDDREGLAGNDVTAAGGCRSGFFLRVLGWPSGTLNISIPSTRRTSPWRAAITTTLRSRPPQTSTAFAKPA